jgi:fumarate hydratase subunit beta
MSSNMKRLTVPCKKELLEELKAGDEVLLTGTIYSARDQAHKRLFNLYKKKTPLPLTLKDQWIYYMGPSPARPNEIIGSCGPTTAARMDTYTPFILETLGVCGIIGKGERQPEVTESIMRSGAAYFYAFGGCGALYNSRIHRVDTEAFPELGPEAIYRLEIKDFPVVTAIAPTGDSVFARVRPSP